MIHRELESVLRQKLDLKKVIVVYGARQVGKSSLLQMIFGGNPTTLWLTGEDSETRNLMENLSLQNLSLSFSAYKTLIIDEAQNVLNIGRCLKIIHDNMPDLQRTYPKSHVIAPGEIQGFRIVLFSSIALLIMVDA